jgi:diguanylate cyclase (GGDEF)-like protein
MPNEKLEQKYKRIANHVIVMCTVIFCLVAIGTELANNRFDYATIVAVVSVILILAILFLQRNQSENIPFLVLFLVYASYLGLSLVIESLEYFYYVYVLILSIGVIYFNVKNYLGLIVVTQIINLILSIYVITHHISGMIWVHFGLQLGASAMLFMVARFTIDKSDAISSAFASFSTLMRVTPSVLILISKHNEIKYLNQAARNNLNIKNPDAFIGRNFLELFNEDSAKMQFEELAKKREFYEGFQKITIDGQIKTFDIFANEMPDSSGGEMFFMLSDISEIVRLKELAEQDSLIDSLIQIPNRRAFDRQIAIEWNHAQRDKVNLSFLMIDIDFFKHYNDTYGHRQGDELLKTAGLIFKRCVKRSTDFIARLGGEEFGVLMYATNSYQANVIAERIRKSVEDEVVIALSGEQTQFTVSIGTCSIIPRVGIEYNYLIEEADKALYKAKGNGRNRVWIADLAS